MKNLFVQTNSDHWEVKWQGAERASSTHPTKLEAVESAKILAKNTSTVAIPVSLKIKKLDGSLEVEYSYPRSADPFPPKG